MYKEEFTRLLAKKHERPQAHYAKALAEILAGIQEQLAQGKSMHFLGFGSFQVKERKGGSTKDFKTKQLIPYDPYRQVVFRAGDVLKQAVKKLPGKAAKTAKKSNGPVGRLSNLTHKKKKK